MMNKATCRTTDRLESDVHPALKDKSSLTNQSVSMLVNNAVRQMLAEDLEDLAAFEQRTNEPLFDFEDLLRELQTRG